MSRSRTTFKLVGAAGLLIGPSVGCTRNYYYGNSVPVCEAPPVYAAPASIYGQVCEVPTRVGGAVLSGSGSDARTLAANDSDSSLSRSAASPPPARVVSQPISGGPNTGFGNRLGWRSQSDGPSTRISGDLDGDRFE